MRPADDSLSEILFLLDIGDPPFGSSDLGLDQVLVLKLEEIALGVVARIGGKLAEACCGSGNLGEKILAVGIAVVVRRVHGRDDGIGVVLEELSLVGSIGLSAVFPQEEVALEGHLGPDADGEETAVVAVIHRGDVLDGVALEVELADLDGVAGVDTEHRTDTVVDGIVHEGKGTDLGGLADIHRIAAAAEDVIHIAGVERELADLDDIVVVAVEEACEVVCDLAAYHLDGTQFRGTAGMLDQAGVGRTSVELDAFKIDVAACGEVSGQLDLADDHGLGAVGTDLSVESDGAFGLDIADLVRRAREGQVDVISFGHEADQVGGVGHGDGRALLGPRPSVHAAARSAQVVKGQLVLGGRLEALEHRSRCLRFGGGEGELLLLASLDGHCGDMGDFKVVGDVGRPAQGDGRGRTVSHLKEEVVLDSPGGGASIEYRPY